MNFIISGITISVLNVGIYMHAYMKNELSDHDEPSGACPNFFKALCYKVSQGGDRSYYSAGYELARHLSSNIDDDTQLKKLVRILETKNEIQMRHNIRSWLKSYLPRCMERVPSRRQNSSFMDGFVKCIDDGNADLYF